MANNKDLFRNALIDAQNLKTKMMLEDAIEIFPSEKHKFEMERILKGKSKPSSFHIKKRILIAAIVALLALLVGCTYIGRQQIADFFEEIFGRERIISVVPSDDVNAPSKMEELYKLTYLPSGYSRVLMEEDSYGLMTKYKDNSGNEIIFYQRVAPGAYFHYDAVNGVFSLREIAKNDVYHADYSEEQFYLWTDQRYAFELYCSEEFSEEEIAHIMESVTLDSAMTILEKFEDSINPQIYEKFSIFEEFFLFFLSYIIKTIFGGYFEATFHLFHFYNFYICIVLPCARYTAR